MDLSYLSRLFYLLVLFFRTLYKSSTTSFSDESILLWPFVFLQRPAVMAVFFIMWSNVADCCKLWLKRGQVFWLVFRALLLCPIDEYRIIVYICISSFTGVHIIER